MKSFNLRDVYDQLQTKLKNDIVPTAQLKFNIDVSLPSEYNDEPDGLTRPIEEILFHLYNECAINRIQVNVQKLNEYATYIVLMIDIKVIFPNSIHADLCAGPKEYVNEVLQGFKNIISGNSTYINGDSANIRYNLKLNLSNTSHNNNSRLPFGDLKVLVAEDNEINALVFISFLEEWGIAATLASDGLEAVQQLQEKSFDLVLMDIYMPIMDGIQAAKQIREFNTTVPIIALSASTLEQDRNSAYDAGINDFLLKPVSSADLFSVMKKNLK